MLLKYTEFDVLAVERASGEVVMEAEAITRQAADAAHTAGFQRAAHRHEFDYERRPGFIYVRSRAISSRTNDNFDQFPAPEIKKAWATFIGKPVFVNHHNANHRRARGFIIDAALHEDVNPDGSPDTWVEVLMEVDAVRFPRLAEAVIRGDIARTSMGTDVTHSFCTACGNKAVTPADYCAHIPAMKGQKVFRFNAELGKREQVVVAEVCHGLGFFENSLLVEPPADPTAFVLGVDGEGLQTAAAKFAAIVDEQPVRLDEALAADFQVLRVHAGLTKTADEDQCPYCSGDSLMVQGIYTCEDGHQWSPSDPAAIAYHSEASPTFGQLQPEPGRVSRLLAEAEQIYVESGLCSECNPLYGLPTYLCSPHAFLRKKENFGTYDSIEALAATFKDGQSVKSISELRPGHNVFYRDARHGAGSGTAMSVSKYDGTSVTLHDHRTGFTTQVRDKDLDPVNGVSLHHHPGPILVGPGHRPHQMAAALAPRGEGYCTALINKGHNQCPCNEIEAIGHFGGLAVCSCGHTSESHRGEAIVTEGTMAQALRSQGYGETKAPAQVDTLRIDRCPVCKDEDGFNGEKCSVCGHVEPPEHFRDPDLTKARQVDLRQDQGKDGATVDENGNPVSPDSSIPGVPNDHDVQPDLQCTNCGEVFSAEGDESASDTDEQDPAAQAPGDPAGDAADPNSPKTDGPPPSLDEMADKSDADLGLEDEIDDDDDDAEEPSGNSDVVEEPGDEDLTDEVVKVDPTTGQPIPAKPVDVDPMDPQTGDPQKPTDPEKAPLDPSKDPTITDQSEQIEDENGVAHVDNAQPNPETTTPANQPELATDNEGDLVEVQPNQTCPICGEGTLAPMPTAQTGLPQQDIEDQQVVDPSKVHQ